jgi:hypothetical protein
VALLASLSLAPVLNSVRKVAGEFSECSGSDGFNDSVRGKRSSLLGLRNSPLARVLCNGLLTTTLLTLAPVLNSIGKVVSQFSKCGGANSFDNSI